MSFEIYEINYHNSYNYPRCYLLYENFLVVNLDKTQIDDCMQELREGRPYKYKFKPSFWKFTSDEEIRLNTCVTFILNSEFEARC